MKPKRNILVTSALPYANGSLHLGNILEFIQTDIWVRYQKMQGQHCTYVCGSDAHGTPIMLQAQRLNITPEALVEKAHAEHKTDLRDFQINTDEFYTTHSEENKFLSDLIFKRLQDGGNIKTDTIQQAYDPVANMFLPDRFVKGECPRCGTADQYGDSCDRCGATYSPSELKHPISLISGTTPIQKSSEHLFFDLPAYKDFLEQWTQAGHLQEQIANKLGEWFKAGLKAWDISRDKPYFGFEIPGFPDKFFYVWLDAPIGYIASFKHLCEKRKDLQFDDYWKADSQTELYHFIGKDIVYFHALFWPAMLKGADFRTPSGIFVHGFLTINGEKMSKSKGTFIKARTYLNHLPAESLRYYYAAKLTNTIDDIDLNFNDFLNRVNADLVGKVVNIASRCAKFINEHFNNALSSDLFDESLLKQFMNEGDLIADCYEQRDDARAIRAIMQLADKANQFIDEHKPWKLIKEPEKTRQVQSICTQGLNFFRILMIYLKPVLPTLAQQTEAFLQVESFVWDDSKKPLLNHTIAMFKPLLERIDPQKVTAMMTEAQSEKPVNPEKTESSHADPILPVIEYDDFAKIDLRIGTIKSAELIEGSDKLLKLIVDLGTEERQIFAGIKTSFPPETLVGKQSVFVANLAPRKMRFGVSEGMMILASGKDAPKLYLIEPENGAIAGMRVK